ncbi:MAG: cytochrome P450, partial [Bacteroidota bacterium]
GTIPANATVTCLIGAANRDERKYEQADTFNIFRSEIDEKKAYTGAANHTAFALGRHFCVGSLLAKTEVNIATNLLLDNLKNIQFQDAPPTEVGVFTRAPQEMWITYD